MDSVLHALGAPRRRDILRIVRRRERSAGDIHRALGDVTFGAVSQHLGVLERAGLVTARRDGRSRLYQSRPEGLAPLREWLECDVGRGPRVACGAGGGRGDTGEEEPPEGGSGRPAGRRRREPHKKGEKK